MANNIEKIPCGGFFVDASVLEFKDDPQTKQPVLSVTANVPVSGAEFIILKSTESAQLYKITVDDSGTLKAVTYNPSR